MTPVAPPSLVLEAFSLHGDLHHLTEGQGETFRIADAFLKPYSDIEEAEWALELQHTLFQRQSASYRVPEPLTTTSNRYLYNGWGASRLLSGRSGPQGRYIELLKASRAFHNDLKALVPKPPPFLARRDHRWARADRIAWAMDNVEAPVVRPALQPVLDSLLPLRHPLTRYSVQPQLVHGDLSENVLFADGQAPGIIDFSPYWRPVEYAEAILAVDGIVNFGEGNELLDIVGRDVFRRQMLIRASIFRLISDSEWAELSEAGEMEARKQYQNVLALIRAWAEEMPDVQSTSYQMLQRNQ